MSHLLELLSNDGLLLEFCRFQTDESCMVAVKQNGLALKYVRKPTYLICLEAVIQNPDALVYVPYSLIEKEYRY